MVIPIMKCDLEKWGHWALNINELNDYISKAKRKHLIISLETEKAPEEIQHSSSCD